jgi:hypothetical protein
VFFKKETEKSMPIRFTAFSKFVYGGIALFSVCSYGKQLEVGRRGSQANEPAEMLNQGDGRNRKSVVTFLVVVKRPSFAV